MWQISVSPQLILSRTVLAIASSELTNIEIKLIDGFLTSVLKKSHVLFFIQKGEGLDLELSRWRRDLIECP